MATDLNHDDEWIRSHVSADWSSLPPEYSYVIDPCKKYALRICAYGETMPLELTEDQMAELRQCARMIKQNLHNQRLGTWAAGKRRQGKLPRQRKSPEMAMVSTLLGMLDEYGFSLD